MLDYKISSATFRSDTKYLGFDELHFWSTEVLKANEYYLQLELAVPEPGSHSKNSSVLCHFPYYSTCNNYRRSEENSKARIWGQLSNSFPYLAKILVTIQRNIYNIDFNQTIMFFLFKCYSYRTESPRFQKAFKIIQVQPVTYHQYFPINHFP